MAKNYNRKGTTNSEVIKSVLGSDYVSLYGGATTDKQKQKNKEPKCSSKSPPVRTQKLKSTPASTPQLPKSKPLARRNNQYCSNIITDLIKSFDFSYDELLINFRKKQIVVKDADKVYHVFGFDGTEQVQYSFNGDNIKDKK